MAVGQTAEEPEDSPEKNPQMIMFMGLVLIVMGVLITKIKFLLLVGILIIIAGVVIFVFSMKEDATKPAKPRRIQEDEDKPEVI